MLSFTVSALLSLPSVRAAAQPDALIVFFSFPTGPVGAFARSWYGLPYLVSLRGGDVPGLTPEVNWIHRLLAPIRRHILKHATAVVANAEGLRKLSEATDLTRVHVIPNGVDTEFFQPSPTRPENRTSGRPFRLLFVGRFQGQKNLPYLLQECSRLPPGSFELHFVGDGPLAAELRALSEQLGLASSVIWHGWLPRVALRDIYQSVDCFTNPSLYEGMPNVVLEAMACALPVIASNIPGNDALVVPGKTGSLFDLHESGALFRAIGELMADPARCSELGSTGRARVVSEFSWRTIAEGYLELLKQAPAASRAS
jgi:glycosyltransferase involved in cell wall biosynthesis